MFVTVKKNCRLTPDFYRMEVAWPPALPDPRPGQFVMVRTRTTTDPLWRRPFGVHDFSRGRGGAKASLLFQVVGPTTGDLAARSPGESVDLLGPLGRPFSLEGEEHWLVAGGRGIAPLYYLARRLKRKKRSVKVMIGGCTRDHVLQVGELEKMGFPPDVSTEDGSFGLRGLVTGLLERALDGVPAGRREGIMMSACGPEGMLKAVGELAARYGTRAQLSLDTLMACGQGYCQGCTVTTRKGHRLCCRDGPVFPAEDLTW